MSIQTYWQLDVTTEPTRSEIAARPPAPTLFRDVRTRTITRYDYYVQVAQAAAQTAFDGLFLPHRAESDDSGIVAAAIAREVPRLVFVAEFPASVGSAVYAAKQAVSFQRFTHDRLGWAIAPEAAAPIRAQEADRVADGQLLNRTEEFLTVARGVHGTQPFSFSGTHFEVQGGGFSAPINRVPFPHVFLQGEGEALLALSARLGDVHLFAAAPPAQLQKPVERLFALAAQAGRSVEAGVIQPVLAREGRDDARRAAQQAGLGGAAIVGDYADVAAGLAALVAQGLTHIVLTAPTALEDAYIIGQHVLPRFRALTDSVRAAA